MTQRVLIAADKFKGPLGHEATAAFALRAGTAVVEMAEASGLQRLPAGPSADSPPSLHGERDSADDVLAQLAKFEDEFVPLEDDDDN